ncbi:Uncharacterised protein [Mycobacteroides abscessus subsp. abscessus]|nr:Uncharacterised protein [Mycobacteroides abscessus subsp. abscessus]
MIGFAAIGTCHRAAARTYQRHDVALDLRPRRRLPGPHQCPIGNPRQRAHQTHRLPRHERRLQFPKQRKPLGANIFGDDFDLAAAGKARRDPVVNTESLTDTQPGGQHLACRLDDRRLHAPTGQ